MAEPAPAKVDLSGYVQADVIPYSADSLDELEPESGAPLNEERFLIRRARLRGEAHDGVLSGAIEFDGNTIHGPVARLLAAYARVSYPEQGPPRVALTAGLFKTPFGEEVPAPERDKPFLEPPAFARALFPGNYDAGAMLHGEYGAARWTLAIVNGAPAGDGQWQGVDPTSSFDLVGRVGAEVGGPYRSRFVAGVSAITGQGLHAGSPATKDQLQWVDDNQDGLVQATELTVVPGTAATPSQTFERNAIGFDAQAHWCICKIGTGFAYVEGVIATNMDRGLIYADPIASSRDLRQLGFVVGVVQNLGRYASVGARYDRYDADRDANEREGLMLVGVDKVFSTLGVMATARWRNAHILAQYDHEQNPFGRGDNGAPTTRSDERVTIRAQVED